MPSLVGSELGISDMMAAFVFLLSFSLFLLFIGAIILAVNVLLIFCFYLRMKVLDVKLSKEITIWCCYKSFLCFTRFEEIT